MHVPFLVVDLGLCKEHFGRSSEDPGKFRDEFVRLNFAFSLMWQDVMVTLQY